MRKIPRAVTAACTSFTAGYVFDLAEPGEPFQVTDVVDAHSKPLPSRRLIWAAQLPGRYLVHYERGGYAHSFFVLLIESPGEKHAHPERVIWGAAVNQPLKDYSAFLSALKAGRLDDRLPYGY